MGMSIYLRNLILDKIFRGIDFEILQTYMSIHTADPGDDGSNELSGGGYIRVPVVFNEPIGGMISNFSIIDFINMPESGGERITHGGFWDSQHDGNFLWGGPSTSSKLFNQGDTYEIPSGDLDISAGS